MSRKLLAVAVVLVGLAWSFASPCAAADSVRILFVKPSSGLFPISPARGRATVAYELKSAPYAAIAVGPQFGSGMALTRGSSLPRIRTELVWVTQGRGQVDVPFSVECGPPSPGARVSGIIATLRTSQTPKGPLSSTGPSSTGPWRGVCACSGVPDLTAPTSEIVVAGRPVHWGGKVTLDANADYNGFGQGRCYVSIGYDTLNAGPGPAIGPFVNRFALDSPGNTLASATVQSLGTGALSSPIIHVGLLPGTHTVYYTIDAGDAVPETREDNNQFHFTYTLPGRC